MNCKFEVKFTIDDDEKYAAEFTVANSDKGIINAAVSAGMEELEKHCKTQVTKAIMEDGV